jgi:hypothetical protein
VQLDVVAVSPAWVYSVIPLGPVRTVPKLGVLAAPTMTPGALEAPPPMGVTPAPLDVHAATARTAEAKRMDKRLRDMCELRDRRASR